MNRLRRLVVLLSTIFASTAMLAERSPAGAEQPEVEHDALSLDGAIELALTRNPAVRRARVAVEAAEQLRRGAGAPRANPAITVEGGPRFTVAGPQADIGVSIEVPFDLGATSRRRRSAASAGVEAARAQLEAAELAARTTVRIRFAELVAAAGRSALAEDAVALAEEMERVARRRHELGEVSILEPNFAGLERADAQGALFEARTDHARAQRSLRALLGLPGERPLVLAPSSLPVASESGFPAIAGLQEHAAQHPARVAADQESRAAKAALEAARGAGAPGLSASGGWSREGDEANLATGGVTFEIPVQRNQIGVAQASGSAQLAIIDAEASELAVGQDLAAALEVWQASLQRHSVATLDALPLAEQNLGLVLRAYEAGKEELLAVLLLQRQALDARRAAIDAELQLHRAAAALERAAGSEVF